MSDGDIFIVDDNPNNLNLLAGILRGHGYRVRMANSGRRVLAGVKADPPELVMLDITMPEMDGYDVCRALKSDPACSQIPIIFISALDDPLDKVKAFQLGAVDYVAKPFQAEEVVARVENQLKIWRLQRETEAKNAELTRAYEEMRRKEEELRRAHEQIARLSERSALLLEDTPAWARSMAREIARAVGARDIGVYSVEAGRFTPLASGCDEPPPWPDASQASQEEHLAPDGSRYFPVLGMSGQLRGALVLHGSELLFGEAERQVVLSFAQHLGTALELRHLREQLTAAEVRRAASRREMHQRGIATAGICPACGRCFTLTEADQEQRGNPVQSPACEVDGVALDQSRLLPYRVEERYRLLRILGEGGMGTVFRALDEKLKRDVALKVIKAEHLNDTPMRLRLSREAETIARIKHPGVIELHDTGELEDGSAFLVMELLQGRDLGSVIDRHGPGSPSQVAALVLQAGAAIGAAHRAGVIHRDIKPDNVFLVPDRDTFRIKVVDFGIARTVQADSRLTATGLVIGTPAYMSPEQVQGHVVDEAGDLYSFAAVVYEALTGRRAVKESQIADILVSILYIDPPPLSSFVAGAPPALDALFAAALAKDAAGRIKDVESWAETTARILRELPEETDGWPEAAWQAERGQVD